MPDGTASPYSCVAASSSPSKTPPCAGAVPCSGSSDFAHHAQSATIPSSQTDKPGKLWPLPRTAPSGKAHRCTDIRGVGTSSDQSRIPVDRSIPQLAMLTIRRAAALDELAVEAPPQLFNGCRLELNPRCHRRHGWRAYRHNRRCQELWFHPCSRASWTGVEDDDPVALGSDQLFGAELPKHTHNNLTNRTDNVASSRWLTRTCSSSRADMPCDAKSSRCRATRWGTVVNAPPEISATKPCTRSLSSGSKAARFV
jgi:hypothetical protein